MARIWLVFAVAIAMAGCKSPESQNPYNKDSYLKGMMAACSGDMTSYNQCRHQYALAHQKWLVDCRRRVIPATKSESGKDEFSPWCIITPSNAFFAQVIVDKDGTRFRNIASFEYDCGSPAAIVVDGQRLAPGQPVIPAFLKGKTAIVQKREPWPRCYQGNDEAVNLAGLPGAVERATGWVKAQIPD